MEIISRDRGDAYAKDATLDGPDAVQVADRWNLLHNLQEALVAAASRYSKQIHEAAQAVAISSPTKTEATAFAAVPVAIEGPKPPPVPTKTTRAERLKQVHRQQRLARYEQVMALHRRGLSLRAWLDRDKPAPRKQCHLGQKIYERFDRR